MSTVKADEFHEDGTRLFNPNRAHGVVYGATAGEARWVQDGIHYRADRLPMGHTVPEKPAIPTKRGG